MLAELFLHADQLSPWNVENARLKPDDAHHGSSTLELGQRIHEPQPSEKDMRASTPGQPRCRTSVGTGAQRGAYSR